PAVVSDRVGCRPDLVTPGETGECFAFGDTDALAQVLVRMAQEPALRRRMGNAARDRVFSGYGPANAVAGTLRAIEAVASRP
ncbi:MAG: glycosyltransferase, partial [Variovorax sp.]